ncbi:hypothetical protein QNH28_22755 [Paenibacillus sp. G2S3]|uniref:hypothetical protein n=1 Tax=Paenibacillus sp. G2S3 TaxID=3047872 RepID=UPI0024C17794|nr:hypothetical protein [Paenibacillus sp. G2S3]WHY18276.1 hypothetical protein QNH28_22755 [Paenibacillus sp. G2S3]
MDIQTILPVSLMKHRQSNTLLSLKLYFLLTPTINLTAELHSDSGVAIHEFSVVLATFRTPVKLFVAKIPHLGQFGANSACGVRNGSNIGFFRRLVSSESNNSFFPMNTLKSTSLPLNV